ASGWARRRWPRSGTPGRERLQLGEVERPLPDVSDVEDPRDPALVEHDVAGVPGQEGVGVVDGGHAGVGGVAGAGQLAVLHDGERAAFEGPGDLVDGGALAVVGAEVLAGDDEEAAWWKKVRGPSRRWPMKTSGQVKLV